MGRNKAAAWTILDRGKVPKKPSYQVDFTCLNCMTAALLPVLGIPLAQAEQGIVFDPGRYAMPNKIQCPTCGRIFMDDK